MELDGIELDVWLTADNQLAVLHGGYSGEILEGDDHTGDPSAGYIYKKSYAEVKAVQPSTCKLEEVF
jgi:glycerophosphoryl diester phosphodiesterase